MEYNQSIVFVSTHLRLCGKGNIRGIELCITATSEMEKMSRACALSVSWVFFLPLFPEPNVFKASTFFRRRDQGRSHVEATKRIRVDRTQILLLRLLGACDRTFRHRRGGEGGPPQVAAGEFPKHHSARLFFQKGDHAFYSTVYFQGHTHTPQSISII